MLRRDFTRKRKRERGGAELIIRPRAFKRSRSAGPLRMRRANRRTGGFQDLEVKFVDYFVNDAPFTTGWAGGEMEDATALSVSAVAQGDGESQRDGRKYSIHSVHIRGTIYSNALDSVASVNEILVRVCLVWDQQTNVQQLNAEDVMLAVAAGEDTKSFRNLSNSSRFKVLKNFEAVLPRPQVNEGAVNLFATQRASISFSWDVKFKVPIKVICSGTTAAITSITDNSLHIIGVADNTAAIMSYTSRVRFTG